MEAASTASETVTSSVLCSSSSNNTWKAHVALALVQLLCAANNVISKVALNAGINQLVFSVLRDLIAISILAPSAFFLEKRTRPPITKNLLISFFLLGLTGIFGNQFLFLIGLSYTSPTYAAAIMPSIPVFTFLFTVIMGTDRVNLLRYEGWAKVGGSLICVSGAILMALYHGPALIGYTESVHVIQREIGARGQPEPSGWFISGLEDLGLDHFRLGVMFFVGNCLCMAAYIAIQAPVLKKYPANISLTAYSYFFGAVLMVTVSLFTTNGLKDWVLTPSEILAIFYAGTITSAVCYGLNAWCNKILGPALVSLYMPLQPVFTALLSQIFLGSQIYLGRRTRPPITKDLLISFFLLGLTGTFGNQLLFIIGLRYTNPTYATAIMPAIPVFTFLLAVIMGTERVNLFRYEGWTKVGGILICVSGAILMVLYHGPALIGYTENVHVIQREIISARGQPEPSGWFISGLEDLGLDHFHLGVMCLIGTTICMAAFLAIQAQGAITSAVNYGLITWCNKILGPSLVALYIPLQPLFAVLLSQIFLGSLIYLGSILGGSFIIVGLYMVTLASYRERQATIELAPQSSCFLGL